MRSLKLALLAGFSLVVMTACGSSNPTPTPTSQGSASCAAGQVYSITYGCLAQGACQPGFGMLQNSCVPLSAQTGVNTCAAGLVNTNYGCSPQSNCPSGYAMYNNGCVVATTQGGYPNTPGYPTPGYNNPAQSCPAGTYSVVNAGCLSQGACPYGYVTYQNQCYQLIAPNGYYSYYGRTRVYGGGGFVFNIHFGN